LDAELETEKPDECFMDMHQALGTFLGMGESESYDFKSPEQKKAVRTVCDRLTDALVILPTGGGKSLSFMLPCHVETDLITILIVPLVALQQDMLSRCEAAGIDAVSWSGRDRVGVRIVVASIEHVETESYARFVEELHRQHRLARIVVDEAHLVLMWASFRTSMHSVATCIRPIGVIVPVILLTATAPPRIVSLIADMCGISRFETIRSETFRPNISYRVIRLEAPAGKSSLKLAVAAKVLEVIEKYRDQSRDNRIVVYLLRRSDVEALKNVLCCDPDTDAYQYHAGMSATDRREAQDSWSRNEPEGGNFKVMVATSAFGAGIDNPSIRAVLHIEGAANILQFVQESGRAGRDGKYAESIVLSFRKGGEAGVPDWQGNLLEALHYGDCCDVSEARHGKNDGFGDFRAYLSMKNGCRRGMLDSFCDGRSSIPPCSDRMVNGTRAVMCDICEERKSERSSLPGESEAIVGEGGQNQEMSGNKSRSGNDRGSAAKPGGGGNNWGARSVSDSASVAQGRRRKSELEVSELCHLARKLSGACAVCTVRSGIEVTHGTVTKGYAGASNGSKLALPCQLDRCDRCGIQGHSWQVCQLNPKPERNNGCARCGIGKHCGIMVHGAGEFGKQSCPLKNVLSVSLLCWEDLQLRKSLKMKHTELQDIQDINEYARWLHCTSGSVRDGTSQTGLALIATWTRKTFLEGGSVALR
jgi:superfamily II DNA or RNA helicase